MNSKDKPTERHTVNTMCLDELDADAIEPEAAALELTRNVNTTR